MATNPTNSNTVSILNLPQSQLATPTDYIVLQTSNGTQIITFQNFNVVKTDIYGNATVIGNLSGSNASFVGGINTITLTASQYYTTGGQQGYNPPLPGINYYDSFTISNGLIISAIPTSVDYQNNPLYTSLNTSFTALSSSVTTQLTAISATLNAQLTSMSAYLTTQFQVATASYSAQIGALTSYSTGIYDATVTPIIQPSTPGSLTGVIVQFSNIFTQGLPISLPQITYSNFIISPGATNFAQATAFYYVSPFIAPNSITSYGNGTGLQVTVSAANAITTPIPINVRLLLSYNAAPH